MLSRIFGPHFEPNSSEDYLKISVEFVFQFLLHFKTGNLHMIIQSFILYFADSISHLFTSPWCMLYVKDLFFVVESWCNLWVMQYSSQNSLPANIYLFKVNNKNIRQRHELPSKIKTKTPERHWRSFGVLIVNFEHISQLFTVFLLLTLKK